MLISIADAGQVGLHSHLCPALSNNRIIQHPTTVARLFFTGRLLLLLPTIIDSSVS